MAFFGLRAGQSAQSSRNSRGFCLNFLFSSPARTIPTRFAGDSRGILRCIRCGFAQTPDIGHVCRGSRAVPVGWVPPGLPIHQPDADNSRNRQGFPEPTDRILPELPGCRRVPRVRRAFARVPGTNAPDSAGIPGGQEGSEVRRAFAEIPRGYRLALRRGFATLPGTSKFANRATRHFPGTGKPAIVHCAKIHMYPNSLWLHL